MVCINNYYQYQFPVAAYLMETYMYHGPRHQLLEYHVPST
jgi:hypothetical protein